MPPEGILKDHEVRRIAKALLFAPTDCPPAHVLVLHGILCLIEHPALTKAIKEFNPDDLIAALNTVLNDDNAFEEAILNATKEDARKYAAAIVAVVKEEKTTVKRAIQRLCSGPSSPFPSETAANPEQAWELLAALVETASGRFKISTLRAIVVAIYGPDANAVQAFDRLQPSLPEYTHDYIISKWPPILGNVAADNKDISDGVVRPSSVTSTRLRSWRTALQYMLEDAGITSPVCLPNIFRAIATAPLVAGVRWDPLTHAAGRLSMAQAMATMLPSRTLSSVGSGTGPDLVTRAVLYRLPVLTDISLVSAVIAAADSTPAESYDLLGQDVIILRASGAPVLELPAFLLNSFTSGQPGQRTPGGARCTDMLALPQGQLAAGATRTFSSNLSGLSSFMEDGTLPANSDSGARLLQLLLTIRRTDAQTSEMEQLMSDMSVDTWEKVIDHFAKVLDKEISKRYITMVQFLANRPVDGTPGTPASPAPAEITTMMGDAAEMARTVQMVMDKCNAHGKQLELLQIIASRLITLLENGPPLDKATAEALANNPPPRTDEQRLEGLRNMVANDVVPTFGAHRTLGMGGTPLSSAAAGGSTDTHTASNAKAPTEPFLAVGSRNISDFFSRYERFFTLARIPEDQKVSRAALAIRSHAITSQWDAYEAQLGRPATWPEFKHQVTIFACGHAAQSKAIDSLFTCTQGNSSVDAYVSRYSQLITTAGMSFTDPFVIKGFIKGISDDALRMQIALAPGNVQWTNLSSVMSTASTLAVEQQPRSRGGQRRSAQFSGKPPAAKHAVNFAASRKPKKFTKPRHSATGKVKDLVNRGVQGLRTKLEKGEVNIGYGGGRGGGRGYHGGGRGNRGSGNQYRPDNGDDRAPKQARTDTDPYNPGYARE